MAAEPSSQIQSFIDGRANLRSLTKWLLSGIAGVVTLVVGASTFSKLGSLGFPSWRLGLAAACLAIAGAVCWWAVMRAILVLKSEIFSLAQFGKAESGDLKDAVDKVSESLQGQLGDSDSGAPLSVKEFARSFSELRSKAWADASASTENDTKEDDAKAKEAVAVLDRRRQVVLQACLSALVELRFDAFIEVVSKTGWAALAALLIFVYAANPPKTADVQAAPPSVVSLSPDTLKGLAALPHAACCLGPATAPPGAAPTPPPPADPWALMTGWAFIFVGLTLFLFFRHLSRERRRG